MSPRNEAEFGECQFLKDYETELQKHERLSSKNATVILKKFDMCIESLSDLIGGHDINVSAVRRLVEEKNTLQSKLSARKSQCEDLETSCKKFYEEIQKDQEEAFTLASEVKHLNMELTDLLQDTKQQQTNFKLKIEATKKAKLFYKDLLECHISRISSGDDASDFLLTYCKTRPVSHNPMPDNSVRLRLLHHSQSWSLIATNPPLSNIRKVSQKLEDSQDLQGLLEYLRPKTEVKKY